VTKALFTKNPKAILYSVDFFQISQKALKAEALSPWRTKVKHN